MSRIKFSIRLLVIVFALFCLRASAAVESTITSLSGNQNAPIAANNLLVLGDQWYPFPVGWATIFQVEDATANVVLRYDDSKRTYTDKRWQIDVTYTIKTYNATGTPTTTTGQTLTITYDPREGVQYTDRDMKQYGNTHYAKLTVTGVTYTQWSPASNVSSTTSSTIPSWLDDVYLDLELHIERYYNLPAAATPTLTLNENMTVNELDVSWTYVQGAESYDLEWLFIDVGTATAPFTGSYDYDWRNATRVNVPNQHYSIPLAFPKGILMIRLRGVGIDWDNYVNNSLFTRGEADWTDPVTTGNTTTYTSYRFDIDNGLLPGMNWAYSAGFAEDGKRMDGAQFYDGLMRGREAVSNLNSEGVVLVGSGAYDFEGRPVVSFLPYPAEINTGIHYYGGNVDYDREDFDRDNNVDNPAPVGTSGGSGAYYSNGSVEGINGNTPDAGHYPYTRVTYINDGTNRPSTSAAAGDNLHAGSGRETQYFYGTPTQTQLDRLFGNEVGYATHYKKNFVVDPNGVVSVAYIDQHGRVIATALAGETPANLVAIDNPSGNPTTATLTDDLLVNNVQRTSGDGTESQFTLTVTETAEHDFTYTVGTICHTGTCYTECVDCKYDLVIALSYPSGRYIDLDPLTADSVIRATNISSGTYTFSITLNPGTYRVTKILTLNQAYLDQVREDYIAYAMANSEGEEESECPKIVAPSPVPCVGDCHSACEQHYKRLIGEEYHYYYDDGTEITDKNAADIAQELIEDCRLHLCDQPATPNPCEVKRQAMIDDLSPGGQYFDNLPDKFTINNTTGLQALNGGYDIDGWLDGDHSSEMLDAVNAVNSTSYTTWTEVRANWEPAFAEAILEWHPEYCAWNYFCNWECSYLPDGVIAIPITVNDSDAFAYEQATMYSTDGNFSGSDGFYWNPLNKPYNNSPNAPSTALANTAFMPKGATNDYHQDPRLVGCRMYTCEDPSVNGKTVLETYLDNFLPAYDENDVFIGYYNLWYVALDPDGIASGTYNSELSSSTLDIFTALHGTGGLISDPAGPGQITPYQFFRSVYFYYRNLVIEQGFAGNDNVGDCQEEHENSSALYDDDGYLIAGEDNPITTPEGFTILYPRNPLIGIYGNGCDDPTPSELADIIEDLVEAGGENPLGIDNEELPASTGSCSCKMLYDFALANGYDISNSADHDDIAAALNDELGVTSYDATSIANWYAECESADPSLDDLTDFPQELTCSYDAQIEDVEDALLTNCEQENSDLANYNAYVTYQNQLQAAADAYMEGYVSWCTGSADETFTVKYDLHEYYYTLYYYDQAGNLVKTVPPEGVNIIDLGADRDSDTKTNGAEIKTYRKDFRDGTTTSGYDYTPGIHDMRSQYAYNSLQQPVIAHQNEKGTAGSNSWESGETSFWYDYLGRLVVSQNSKQAAMSPPAYSYTLYDGLGRIYEVGELQTSTALLTDNTGTGSRNSSGEYYYYEINHVASPTALETWVAGGTKQEVTYTFYDEEMYGLTSDVTSAFGTPGQENLRNRVSAVVYDDDPAAVHDLYNFTVGGQPGYLSAYHYSYDVHGNVKTVVQETPPLKTHNQNVKTTTYEYDLVSGNVNAVHYQSGQRDEFHHYYEYDADNRLHAAYSSRDGITREKESKQFYYTVGGIARVEIGDKTVQGMDYAYTINGWLKGLNRNTVGDYGDLMSRDLGQDAEGTSTNLNRNVAADAAGFTLHYWLPDAGAGLSADYTPVTTSPVAFEATMSSTAYGGAILNQYNGNIAGMTTALLDNVQTGMEVQGRAFTYDQLYRIKQSLAFHMDGGALSGNAWQNTYTQDNRYREEFSYDWNGNIKTVDRYSGDLSMGTAVKSDQLTYVYGTNSNQLVRINDAKTACAYSDDLDDQGGGTNYSYDPIGALIEDVSERITNTTPDAIEWNPYGKMKAVHKDQANNTNACTSSEHDDADVEYLYTATQQRLCKIVKPHKSGGAGISDQDQWTYTWYVYDAGGMVMGVYEQNFRVRGSDWTVNFDLQEHDVYGSGRVGLRHGDDEAKYHQDFSASKTGGVFNTISYSGSSAAYSKTHYTRTIGAKQYEIANHLGNVLVTVSDKRLLYTSSPLSATEVDWYNADVLSYADYYVFGAPQTGRAGGDSYRYGFNGMEKTDEMHGNAGDFYSADYREYDARLGRWLSKDPIVKSWESPYAGFANNPIYYKDPSGLDPGNGDGNGNKHWVSTPTTRDAKAGYWEHTVNKGESPSSISQAQGISLQQLATWNPTVFKNYDPNNTNYWNWDNRTNWNIDPGQSLVVSQPATQQTGPDTGGPYPVEYQVSPLAFFMGVCSVLAEREALMREWAELDDYRRRTSEYYENPRTGEIIHQPGVGRLQPDYTLDLGLMGVSRYFVTETAVKVATTVTVETTVLGSYDAVTGGYVAYARNIGAHYFEIAPEIWETMTAAEQWAANLRFLDAAIARGDNFVLANSAFEAQEGTFFWRELQYLYSKGYKPAADGMSLIKP